MANDDVSADGTQDVPEDDAAAMLEAADALAESGDLRLFYSPDGTVTTEHEPGEGAAVSLGLSLIHI